LTSFATFFWILLASALLLNVAPELRRKKDEIRKRIEIILDIFKFYGTNIFYKF
jgi:hypothetical protein